jgi:putative ABC transport system permease protein
MQPAHWYSLTIKPRWAGFKLNGKPLRLVGTNLFNLFAGIAIFISCLGLLGLATFTAQRRRKEIGIRKVLGAGVGNIIRLISMDFLKLVFVAIVIGTPIAWLVMNKWLQNFAYRTNISWWIFVVVGLVATLIALITVSWQAVRAAIANPVKSLRTE